MSTSPPRDISALVQSREPLYGDFMANASISRQLKRIIQWELDDRGKHLPSDMHEALDMICTKIARIINGDEEHVDSWDDIAGYAKLVSQRLSKVAAGPDSH